MKTALINNDFMNNLFYKEMFKSYRTEARPVLINLTIWSKRRIILTDKHVEGALWVSSVLRLTVTKKMTHSRIPIISYMFYL